MRASADAAVPRRAAVGVAGTRVRYSVETATAGATRQHSSGPGSLNDNEKDGGDESDSESDNDSEIDEGQVLAVDEGDARHARGLTRHNSGRAQQKRARQRRQSREHLQHGHALTAGGEARGRVLGRAPADEARGTARVRNALMDDAPQEEEEEVQEVQEVQEEEMQNKDQDQTQHEQQQQQQHRGQRASTDFKTWRRESARASMRSRMSRSPAARVSRSPEGGRHSPRDAALSPGAEGNDGAVRQKLRSLSLRRRQRHSRTSRDRPQFASVKRRSEGVVSGMHAGSSHSPSLTSALTTPSPGRVAVSDTTHDAAQSVFTFGTPPTTPTVASEQSPGVAAGRSSGGAGMSMSPTQRRGVRRGGSLPSRSPALEAARRVAIAHNSPSTQL